MRSLPRLVDPRRSVAPAIALLVIVYLVTLGILEERGFWISDNANKFLQLQAIQRSGYADYSLPLPGRTIDPEYDFKPILGPFSVVADGELYSQYSPVFATIATVPYALFGFSGLYIIPLLATLLTLLGVARIALDESAAGMRVASVAVLLTGLCTPIWFYSVVFWEHTLAVCCCVWAVRFALRFLSDRREKDLIAASVLAAASVYTREELLLFYAVLLGLLSAGATERRARTALISLLTVAVAVLPLLLFHWFALGSPLGHHVSANATGLAEHVSARPGVAYRLLAAAGSGVLPSLILTAPFLVTLLWNPRVGDATFRFALPLIALVAAATAAVSFGGYLTAASPIGHMLHSNSLFPAAAITLLALLRPGGGDRREVGKRVWILVLGFAALYTLFAPPASSVGIHWGNRFLLVTYPLLALLAARNLMHWLSLEGGVRRWWRLAFLPVVAMSLAAQVFSIHILDAKKDFSVRLNRAAHQRPERVLVTNLWWVPQALYSRFYELPMFCVRSEEQLESLQRALDLHGHQRYLFVSRAVSGSPARSQAMVVEDGALRGFFSVSLAGADTGSPRE